MAEIKRTCLARRPLFRLRPQQVVDKVFGIITDVLPIPFVVHHAAGTAFVDEVLEALGAERRVAAEQGVGDDAERPHVDGLAVALPEHHLGRRVAERARHGGEHLILGAERLRDAKVGQDQVRICGFGEVEKVLRFEVCVLWLARGPGVGQGAQRVLTTVDDVVLVQIIDGFHNLPDGLGGILLGEPALLGDSVEQLSADRQLGDDVVLVLDTVDISLDEVRCSTPQTRRRDIPSTRTSRQT